MRFLVTTCLATVALTLTACGLDSACDRPGAAALVPEDAVIYGEATLDPDGDQAQAVRDIAARFPGGEDFPARIERELATALEEEGVDYARDIEPVLGEQVVFFITDIKDDDAEGALVAETDDEDGAREALGKLSEGEDVQTREYEGTEILEGDDDEAAAVFDDHIVIGTAKGVRDSIDANSSGDSIEDSDEATEALERFDDPLAAFYFDGEALVDSLGAAAAAAGPLVKVLEEPYALAVTAEPDAVVIETTIPPAFAQLTFPLAFGSAAEGLGELPADSFVAGGQPELGKAVETLLGLLPEAQVGVAEDQVREEIGLDLREDILAWMGDLTFFARGTSIEQLGGGAVIRTDDPDAARDALDTLQGVAEDRAAPGVEVVPLAIDGAEDGFTVSTPDAPQPIHLALGDDRVVIAYGDEAAEDLLDPSQTLADDEDFTAAGDRLGDDFSVGSYIDVQAALELADNAGASSDPDYQQAKPYLEPFVRVVSGTTEDGDTLVSRTRIELR